MSRRPCLGSRGSAELIPKRYEKELGDSFWVYGPTRKKFIGD